MLKGREEAVIQAVLLYGEIKAMRIFGVKSYVAFCKWWEKHKPKPDTKSKNAEKARKRLSSKKLAYIAGLFDTEVGFGISMHTTKTQRHSYRLFLSYTKMEREILYYLSEIFGGKVRKLKDQPVYKHEMWQLNLSQKEAYLALNEVYPYLRLKKEIARICIEFYKCYSLPEIHLPEILSSQHNGTLPPMIQDISDKLYTEYVNYRRLHPGGLRVKSSTPQKVE